MKRRHKLIIPGEPVAKARPRFNTKTGVAYTPKRTRSFETIVREVAYNKIVDVLTGPVRMEIVFCFPRPKNKIWKTKPMPREWKLTRPDWDNLGKSVCDALNGIAYIDDSQIVDIRIRKYICAGDEKPHTEIVIEEVEKYGDDQR